MVPGSAIGEGWCCELKGAVPGRQTEAGGFGTDDSLFSLIVKQETSMHEGRAPNRLWVVICALYNKN